MTHNLKSTISGIAIACLAGGPLLCTTAQADASSASAVESARDDSWVSLTGTVESVRPNRFTLDYGDRDVTVEMDDWDWYNEARPVMAGKRVTVSGIVDDDFYEKRTIEARTVLMDGTYHYASAADEEGGYYAYPVSTLYGEGEWITMRGTVLKVSDTDEFTLDTGARQIQVDVDMMRDNPLDAQGFPKVTEGNRVSVYGQIDDSALFDPREIQARSVIVLKRDMDRGS